MATQIVKNEMIQICLGLSSDLIKLPVKNIWVDYDKEADFNKLKTFKWLPLPEKEIAPSIVKKRIIKAVNYQLELKDFKKAEKNPDFLIALHTGKQAKVNIRERGYSYGRYGRHGGISSSVDVYQYEEGTAIVDFVDAQSKELIWRGTATAVIDPTRTPKEREKLIDEAVKDMLKNFPPPNQQ